MASRAVPVALANPGAVLLAIAAAARIDFAYHAVTEVTSLA